MPAPVIRRSAITIACLLAAIVGPFAFAQDKHPEPEVIYAGLKQPEAGERLPEGWRAPRGQFTVVQEDGDIILQSAAPKSEALRDIMLAGDEQRAFRVTFKARVTDMPEKLEDITPGVTVAWAAIGAIETGVAGSWRATGNTDGWEEHTILTDSAAKGNRRRVRLYVGNPVNQGNIAVKDITVTAVPVVEEQTGPPAWEFKLPEQPRQVDPSRITGADVDVKAINFAYYVNPSHPDASDVSAGTSADRPFRSVQAAIDAFRRQRSMNGPARIVLAPGVHRVTSAIDISGFMYATRRQPLVIEGTGAPEDTVISGSITEGFEPERWELVDAQKRIYRVDWPYDWGLTDRGYYSNSNIMLHRRELVALDGQLLEPRILDKHDYVDPKGRVYNEVGLLVAEGRPRGKAGYTYQGFAGLDVLEPGSFGVTETKDGPAGKPSLYIRLPESVETLDDKLIEVGFAPTLLRARDKNNLVLRNLTFRHAAGWYNNYFDTNAIDIAMDPVVANAAPPEMRESMAPRGILLENLIVEDNGSTGAQLRNLHEFSIRNCTFRRNGEGGIKLMHSRNGIVENIVTTQNNARGKLAGNNDIPHGGAGMDFSGIDIRFTNCTFDNNHGDGFRGDVFATNLIYENCTFNNNNGRGHWHEISWGPILIRDSEIIGNGEPGFFILNVHDVTLDGCRVIDNGKRNPSEHAQIMFNHSDVRESPGGFYQRGHTGVSNPWSTGFTLTNSVVASTLGPESKLIARRGASAELYERFVKEEWTGRNNVYWNPDSTQTFDPTGKYDGREFVDLDAWKQVTGSEEGSQWAPPPGGTSPSAAVQRLQR